MSEPQPTRLEVVYRVEWGNPYTEPPDGRPRVLAEHTIPEWRTCDHRPPAWIDELMWANKPGYCITWTSYWRNKPERSWSKERKAEARRRNLRKRIEKRWPMFAEMMIAEEMARYPSYYAGEEYNGRFRE